MSQILQQSELRYRRVTPIKINGRKKHYSFGDIRSQFYVSV